MVSAMSREIWRLLHIQPFQPFTVHVSSGAKYTVRDPRRVFVSGDVVIVALKVGRDGVAERTVRINPDHITGLTPLKSDGSRKRK